MSDDDIKPKKGQVWTGRRGLTVRVLGKRVPGDRYDEPRVYCEVIERYSERLSAEELADGMVDYEIGHKDGWNLFSMFGWRLVT